MPHPLLLSPLRPVKALLAVDVTLSRADVTPDIAECKYDPMLIVVGVSRFVVHFVRYGLRLVP